MTITTAAATVPPAATSAHSATNAHLAAGLLLRLLGDPTRMRSVELLADGDRSVAELAELLDVPRSRLGNHLACGLHCGVWASQKHGRHVIYSLVDRGVLALIEHAQQVAAPRADYLASCSRLGPDWV